MNGLEEEWGETVQVVRLNIHEEGARELGQELNFRSTPTFILYDQAGQETWRQVGVINAGAIRQVVAGMLAS